ncbi:guanylate kinase [Acidilutibacter cellobiosedens]|jgi:guanylate kinase|uniref:Guanylate kinase n=2 Tax=Tissierellia TaxID=1737404 RepID=A0A410QC13_9FIRM|nr:guanylate kinase [Tissierellaceae bacterium]QAT61546.1 guanylate kinase [Acidilutibacter cellobiosedens]
MMSKGLLIVISGPSGCGKGTICEELLNRNKSLSVSVSATTRSPRKGEEYGENYFYMDEKKFQEMVDNDEFLEYAFVHNHYYGTPKQFVFEKLKKGEDIILEIDVQGALNVKKIYPEGVFIFILPPSIDELKNRIVKRGTENLRDIALRLRNAYEELNKAFEYEYLVINDEVPNAVRKIEAIIIAEKCRAVRQRSVIKSILD